MSRLRLALFLLALMPLGTCAGGGTPGENAGTSAVVGNPAYEAALRRWVDQPEEDLIAAWGVPERSQRLTDGGQALDAGFDVRLVKPVDMAQLIAAVGAGPRE